jgi:hypothetical protein
MKHSGRLMIENALEESAGNTISDVAVEPVPD